MLAEKQRLALHLSPAAFRARVMEQGVREVAVSGAIGIAAVQLPDFHPDPADRIIVATAISVGTALLTPHGDRPHPLSVLPALDPARETRARAGSLPPPPLVSSS